MRLVIIESPFGAQTKDHAARNVRYARAALLDSLSRGEAPIVSHLLHTQVLDDTDPAQRRTGIAAGLAWYRVAEASVQCVDLGISEGMLQGAKAAALAGVRVESRHLPPSVLRGVLEVAHGTVEGSDTVRHVRLPQGD